VLLDFRTVRSLSPEAFVDLLADQLQVKGVVAGTPHIDASWRLHFVYCVLWIRGCSLCSHREHAIGGSVFVLCWHLMEAFSNTQSGHRQVAFELLTLAGGLFVKQELFSLSTFSLSI
jgi:hypothetical protein